MTLGETLYSMRNMVDQFIREHSWEWELYRTKYQEESRQDYLKKFPDSSFEGHTIGRSLSLQSHIGSDMLIDFVYLSLEVEKKVPFTREYWIRSYGTQCIKNEEDAYINRSVFKDIVAKIKVEFDGEQFTKVEWFEDNDCLIKNNFIVKSN